MLSLRDVHTLAVPRRRQKSQRGGGGGPVESGVASMAPGPSGERKTGAVHRYHNE